jgi:hypothetical protein
MPTFNSISDLHNWFNSSHGQNSVIVESQIKQVLSDAGRELEHLMIEELNNYFDSYEPKVYKRTGNTIASIRVGEPRKISINQWSLDITFDESLANHPSVFGQEQGYTPWLLEVGWNIENKVVYSRPMFTKHPGTHYIQKAVERFNANNPHGLFVTVEHNGERYI